MSSVAATADGHRCTGELSQTDAETYSQLRAEAARQPQRSAHLLGAQAVEAQAEPGQQPRLPQRKLGTVVSAEKRPLHRVAFRYALPAQAGGGRHHWREDLKG